MTDDARLERAIEASAIYGAADVASVRAALHVAGVAFETHDVPISKRVALVQALAAAGIEGAEAGTALRNLMVALADDRKADLMTRDESELPMSEVARNHELLCRLFGVENATAMSVILRSIESVEAMAEKIEDSI